MYLRKSVAFQISEHTVEGGFWKTEVGHNLVARATECGDNLVASPPRLVASTCSHFLTE